VLSLEVLIGGLELLSILDHLVDLGGRQSSDGAEERKIEGQLSRKRRRGTKNRRDSLVDRDLSLSAGSSVKSGDLQETVGVDLESATVKSRGREKKKSQRRRKETENDAF